LRPKVVHLGKFYWGDGENSSRTADSAGVEPAQQNRLPRPLGTVASSTLSLFSTVESFRSANTPSKKARPGVAHLCCTCAFWLPLIKVISGLLLVQQKLLGELSLNGQRHRPASLRFEDAMVVMEFLKGLIQFGRQQLLQEDAPQSAFLQHHGTLFMGHDAQHAQVLEARY